MSPEKPHGEQAGKAKATATLGEKAKVYPRKNEIKDSHVKQLANTRGGTRTHNLLLRREAPYPLGHTSMGTGDRRTDNVSFERIYGKSS